MSNKQKQTLQLMATAEGYSCLSDLIRQKAFDSLSVHKKLDLILKKQKEILQNENQKTNMQTVISG